MTTNKGPHDGGRNSNSRPFNSFAERSGLFLPPLSGRPTLPLPTNHPPLPPCSSLTRPITLDHERIVSQTPTTNHGVDGFRQSFPISTPEILAHVSSLHAKIHQQAMEQQAQSTKFDKLDQDIRLLNRYFIWIGRQIESLQSSIPSRHTASTTFSKTVPGRNSFENIDSLEAQRNDAIPPTSAAAPSINTPFAPSLHYRTPQQPACHQQPAHFQAFQPTIQEQRGTPTSRSQTREDVCERTAVHCSPGADVSTNGKNGTGQKIMPPVVEQQIFIMEHAVIKEEKWSQIHSAFCKRFPEAALSIESFRHLYYSMRKSWGLPPGKGRKAEGKVQDKQAVKERIRRMRFAPY